MPAASEQGLIASSSSSFSYNFPRSPVQKEQQNIVISPPCRTCPFSSPLSLVSSELSGIPYNLDILSFFLSPLSQLWPESTREEREREMKELSQLRVWPDLALLQNAAVQQSPSNLATPSLQPSSLPCTLYQISSNMKEREEARKMREKKPFFSLFPFPFLPG